MSFYIRTLCCLHTYFFFFCQELVELQQVENISDTEGYPSLEGHCRAASLPRLNAEYYVSSSVPVMPCLLSYCSFTVVLYEQHSCDNIRFGKCRQRGYLLTPTSPVWQVHMFFAKEEIQDRDGQQRRQKKSCWITAATSKNGEELSY